MDRFSVVDGEVGWPGDPYKGRRHTDHSGRRSQEDPKRGREDGAAGFTHLASFLLRPELEVHFFCG